MNTSRRIIMVVTMLTLTISAVGYGEEAAQVSDTFRQAMDAEGQLKIYEAREKYALTIQNSGYLTHYAWFLTRFGFSEEAIKAFNRLLPRLSGDPQNNIYLGLAWNHQAIGQLDTALAYYQKRISLTTTDRRQAFDAVRWHLHAENRHKIDTLKKEITSGGDPLVHQRELAEVYLDQGELAEVIRLAATLRDKGQLDLRTHLYLARAYFWSNDLPQAETTYIELNQRSPGNAYLCIEWAKVLIADGRLAEAQALLEKALQLYPAATAARRLLAEVLARQHQWQAATAMADAIPADGGNRLAALMARARSRHFSGQLESAQPIYAQVLDDYPFYPDALWGMTETSIFTGRYADARNTLKRWEQAPADPRLESQQERYRLYTAPAATANFGYYSNSSDFSRTDAGLSGNWYLGDEWHLTTGYRFSGFFQQDFSEIYRNSGFLDVRKGLTDRLQLTGGLIGHAYDNGHQSLNGMAGLSCQLTPELSIHPWFRHMEVIDTTGPFENMAYSHTVSIGAVALNLSADEFGGRIDYRPRPRLSFSGDVRYAEYSDDNRKWHINGEASYRVCLQPDWRIAYNYFFLDYRDPAPVFQEAGRSESSYYDPINFETHSLRLLFRDQSDDDRLAYGAEGALSYIPKSDGTGTYLSAFVSLSLTEDWLLRLHARGYYQNRGVDRFDTTGHYWANNLLLSVEYRF